MQFRYVLELGVVADFQLKSTKPALHEAILPGTASFAGAQRYFQLRTQLLVFVAQVFGTLVAVQYGWCRMFTERIQHGGVGQLGAVVTAEPPANNLPGFEVKYTRQVVVRSLELEVGEVLCPRTTAGHATVVHAGLRTRSVLEFGIRSQGIGWCWYLCCATSPVPVLLAGSRYDHASEVTDASGFGFAPAKMYCEPRNPVERMLGMGSTQCCYVSSIFGLLFAGTTVVVCPTDAKSGRKLFAPSWLDLIQDSYSFG